MASRSPSRNAQIPEETPEPKWIVYTRNAAGIASIMGIIGVSIFAFDNLLPWWKETVESERRREEGPPTM